VENCGKLVETTVGTHLPKKNSFKTQIFFRVNHLRVQGTVCPAGLIHQPK
jgi:hypothetical protein